jgi:hypothetical protein
VFVASRNLLPMRSQAAAAQLQQIVAPFLATRLITLPRRWHTPRDLVERNGVRWDHAGRNNATGLQSGDD